jgi:hypothetical protein
VHQCFGHSGYKREVARCIISLSHLSPQPQSFQWILNTALIAESETLNKGDLIHASGRKI